LGLLSAANAQWRPDARVVGSVSGQFFVSARAASLSAHSLDLATGPNMVTAEPALLVVSCERIKHEMLRRLQTPDRWQGKIFIVLRPARTTNDPITIVPERFAGNWGCGMEMPDAVDRDRLVESIVHACLLEIADRNATNRSAEIPDWLARGLTRQLLGSSEERLILPRPDSIDNGMNVKRLDVSLTDNPRATGPNMRRMNPLADAVETLRTNAPLTFDELSWPTDEQLSDNGAGVYSSSAQLFVDQLLSLENGPASMRAMLAKLPNYLNWQLAFLDAYHDRFQDPLDVEKWWALEQVEFTGRDLTHLWTRDESWRQLDALFHFPIEVQIGDAPPMRSDITFQTIIRGWSRPRQLEVLKKKLWELDLIQLRVSQDFMPIVQGYRQVLQDYYKKRLASARILRQTGALGDKAVDEAVQQLDGLDAQRADMRPKPEAPVASIGQTSQAIAP
jgi:hypothetical protein